MLKKSWLYCVFIGIVPFVVACGTAQRDAINAAINAAQTAIDSVRTDAAKYVPEQLQAAESALQSARDSLSKRDYPAALKAAQDAANKARDLATSAAAKKDEWSKTWSETSASVPKALNDIKARLDAYTRRLPAGLDQSQLDEAKAKYEQLKQSWSDAASQAAQGNLRDAINKIPGIQETLAKLKETLGVK